MISDGNKDGKESSDHSKSNDKRSVDSSSHENIEGEETKTKECDTECVQTATDDAPNMILHGLWPPQLYEHIAVKTKETWILWEVVNIREEEAEVLIRL